MEVNPEQSNKPGLLKDELDRIERILGRRPSETEMKVFAYAWLDPQQYIASYQLAAYPGGRQDVPVARGRTAFAIGEGLHCVLHLGQYELIRPTAEEYFNGQLEVLLTGARPVARIRQVVPHRPSPENGLLKTDATGNSLNSAFEEPKNGFDSEAGTVLEISIVVATENRLIIASVPEPGDSLLLAGLPENGLLLELIEELAGLKAIRQLDLCRAASILENITGLCRDSGLGASLVLDDIPAGFSGAGDCLFIVAKRGKEKELEELFRGRQLALLTTGALTDTGLLEVFRNGEKIVTVPVESLRAEHVPGIGGSTPSAAGNGDKKTAKPPALKLKGLPLPKDIVSASRKLFASLKQGMDGWGRQNGDHVPNGSDATVVALKEQGGRIAACMAIPPFWAESDPFRAGMVMVSEAARRIICSGAAPLSVAICLDLYSRKGFEHLLENGIRDACRKFGIPHHFERRVKAAKAIVPAVAMSGLIPQNAAPIGSGFASEGDVIFMLGNSYNDLHGSHYLRVTNGTVFSTLPHIDLQEEFDVQNHALNLIRKGFVRSAHGVGAGGLFTCLVECAISGGNGFDVETVETFRKDCFLFGESQGRVVVSMAPEVEDEAMEYLITRNVSFTKLGEVLGQELIVDAINFGSLPEWKAILDESATQSVHR